jgi:predicted MFS family arabinose efflux permease
MLSNRWLFLGVLFVVRTSFGFQFQSVASVSSLLREDLGIGHSELGTLIGLYMLPGVVIALPGGMLSKRFGDKRIASYGLLLMAVGAVLLGLAESYPPAVAGRLISGIGAVLLNVVLTKMVTDQFAGREIRTALAIVLTSWPLGIALGLVSQGAIADAASWQLVMHLTAAANVVALVLLLTLVRVVRPAVASEEGGAPGFLIPFRELFLVSVAGIAWGMMNAGFTIHFSFTPDLLAAEGMSTTEAAALVGTGVWITMFSVPLGGYLVERVGRSNAMIAVFSLLSAATLGLFPYLSIPLALSVLFGLWMGPPPGPMVALPSQALSAENRSVGLGVFYTWFYLVGAVGPVVAGVGRDLTDSAATPVLIGAAAFALVLPFVGAFRLAQARASAR